MKYLLLLVFCSTYFLSLAQISGQVQDSDGLPISYATVFNLNKKTGSVTDSIGHFIIDASISDSIRIQHISYKSENFIISKDIDKFLLQRNVNNLKEVVVSKNYAAWIYFRGYSNTVSKMQNESRNRMFGKAVKLLNADTCEKVSLDLDYERNILGKNQEKNMHNRFFEVQRYSEQLDILNDTLSTQLIDFSFFPVKGLPVVKEASSRENAMNDDYIFKISVDSSFYYIDFIPRKIASNNRFIFEIIITKKDTCLISFAAANLPHQIKHGRSNTKSTQPETVDNASFLRIEFENGQGYIATSYSESNLYYSIEQKTFNIRYSIQLRNYAHQPDEIKKRPGKWMIINTFTFNRKLKSKYSDEFWKHPDFPKEVPYDFEKLRSLKLKKELQ